MFTLRMGLHTTTLQYDSFSFTLRICSGIHRVTVLVIHLWMPDRFLQHTIEVTRTYIIARLLDFAVVHGGTSCGRDPPPVKGSDSATITCPCQVRLQALELLTFGRIFMFVT